MYFEVVFFYFVWIISIFYSILQQRYGKKQEKNTAQKYKKYTNLFLYFLYVVLYFELFVFPDLYFFVLCILRFSDLYIKKYEFAFWETPICISYFCVSCFCHIVSVADGCDSNVCPVVLPRVYFGGFVIRIIQSPSDVPRKGHTFHVFVSKYEDSRGLARQYPVSAQCCF